MFSGCVYAGVRRTEIVQSRNMRSRLRLRRNHNQPVLGSFTMSSYMRRHPRGQSLRRLHQWYAKATVRWRHFHEHLPRSPCQNVMALSWTTPSKESASDIPGRHPNSSQKSRVLMFFCVYACARRSGSHQRIHPCCFQAIVSRRHIVETSHTCRCWRYALVLCTCT